MLKLARRARGHFVMLIKIHVHLIRVKPWTLVNYWPISLLSNFNRIFEKLLYYQIKEFLDKNNLMHSSQYGFRKSHSTEHAILDIVETILSNMDKRYFSCGVFIDLKKAFDTVNHQILLDKLNFYSFR